MLQGVSRLGDADVPASVVAEQPIERAAPTESQPGYALAPAAEQGDLLAVYERRGAGCKPAVVVAPAGQES